MNRIQFILAVGCAAFAPIQAHAGLDVWTSIPDPHPETDYYYQLHATEAQLFAIVVDFEADCRLFRRGHTTESVWEEVVGPANPLAVSVAGASDEHVMVTTKGKRLWYSGNGGTTWIDRTQGLPAGATMRQVLVDASGWSFVTISGAEGDTYGVGRSSDFGATWDLYVYCTDCFAFPFRQLESDGSPQNLWLTGNNGFFNAEIHLSLDWGETWEKADGFGFYEKAPIDLVVDPVFPTRSYVLFDFPMFRFDGTEFLGYTYPPFGDDNAALSAPRWDPGVLYAAGLWSSGLLAIVRSGDFGYEVPWETVREGIPDSLPPDPYWNLGKNHLEPHPSPHVPRMYLSYWTMGLFERDFSIEPSATPESHLIVGAHLVSFADPSPNPTSGALDLQLTCAEAIEMNLALIDAGGRSHFETGTSRWEAGRHELGPILSPTLASLPSGVYFVQANGHFGTAQRRVTLIR